MRAWGVEGVPGAGRAFARPFGSARRLAAVDGQDVTGDEAGLARRDEQDCAGDSGQRVGEQDWAYSWQFLSIRHRLGHA